VPPHLEQPRLVGFFCQLVTTPAGADATGGDLASPGYVRFRVTDDTEVTFTPGPQGGYAHTFEHPVDMSRLYEGDRAIEFLLADTPGRLKRDGFLDPGVVDNIALILYYQATVTWSQAG